MLRRGCKARKNMTLGLFLNPFSCKSMILRKGNKKLSIETFTTDAAAGFPLYKTPTETAKLGYPCAKFVVPSKFQKKKLLSST